MSVSLTDVPKLMVKMNKRLTAFNVAASITGSPIRLNTMTMLELRRNALANGYPTFSPHYVASVSLATALILSAIVLAVFFFIARVLFGTSAIFFYYAPLVSLFTFLGRFWYSNNKLKRHFTKLAIVELAISTLAPPEQLKDTI